MDTYSIIQLVGVALLLNYSTMGDGSFQPPSREPSTFANNIHNNNTSNQSNASAPLSDVLKKTEDLIPSTTIKDQLIYLSKPLPLMSSKLYNKANSRKRKIEDKSAFYRPDVRNEWKCPNISQSRNLECGCDIPHTLRCSGDIHGLELIASGLRQSPYTVSLLDCTLKNVSFLSDARIFENVSLNGLVISSGEIKRVHRSAFIGLKTPLLALGLPNNALLEVPWNSLAPLLSLDRLDLSNNWIKSLKAVDFMALPNLTYLELSDNQISSISFRTFLMLKKLITMKIGGNRLGDYANSLQALGQSVNLRELDLSANSIKGPLNRGTIPQLSLLESLNLNRNLLTSIQNGALQNFPSLVTLSLRHNQIDVLQDHAFAGLSSLQDLDLGYNGIVAVSGASLQHLSRLLVLNLRHNFLRSLTSDLILPLPSLRELRLDGNDISIVAKNALDGAHKLRSLSLHDNPLACDCSIKPFAEWIAGSTQLSQDLLGATCATPPHLEGAPLLQIPLDSLNCDGNVNKYDNDVLQQLEALSKQKNLSYVRDFSDVIVLKDLHLSPDYGLILTWSVDLNTTDFACEAVFVYREENDHETLLDNSPFHCESSTIGEENIVSIILSDAKHYVVGDSYRFCLVLAQPKNLSRDLVVGCSNITKMKNIESGLSNESGEDRQSQPDRSMHDDNFESAMVDDATTSESRQAISDIATFDKITSNADDIWYKNRAPNDHTVDHPRITSVHHHEEEQNVSVEAQPSDGLFAYQLMHGLNNSFLPGLGIGILLASIFVLLYGVARMRNDRSSNTAVTTCYAANDHVADIIDCENRNRYLKLQATTTL